MAMAATDNDLLSQAVGLTRIVCSNVQEVMKEWNSFAETISKPSPQPLTRPCSPWPPLDDDSEYIMVKRSVLCHLATEIGMLKDLLPTVLEHTNETMRELTTKLNKTEQKLHDLTNKQNVITNELNQTTHRLDVVIKEFEKEKKTHFESRSELSEVNHQLSYQSDYCTCLGLVCCTLLWRASRNEQAVIEMIGGTKTGDFLSLVSTTTSSFIDSYGNDVPNESSKEMQFLLSLYGVVTNISASAYGREYMANCSEGCHLLNISFNLLSTSLVSQKSAKLQSINQKGLLLVRDLPSIFQVLCSFCQANTSVANKVHCLQLIQSLLLEPHDSSLLAQVPVILLHELATVDQREISQLAKEIIMDIDKLSNYYSSNKRD